MKAQEGHEDMAEDNLMLSTTQNTWRKEANSVQGQGKGKSRQHSNIEFCIWQAHTQNHALCAFPATPNHSRYGLTGQAYTPKSKTNTWTQKGEWNTSIKGEENKAKERGGGQVKLKSHNPY